MMVIPNFNARNRIGSERDLLVDRAVSAFIP